MWPRERWDVVDPDRIGNDVSSRTRRILFAVLIVVVILVAGVWLWLLLAD